MREIIFRGKRIDNGEWVEGYLLMSEWTDGVYIITQDECNHNAGGSYFDGHIDEVIPETVGQYTGKKDMTGVKIFEHDVITNLYEDDYVCFWDECNYEFGIKNDQYDCSLAMASRYITVVGNIHDNPEFLGGIEE